MAYSYRLFSSIEQVDLAEWRQLTAACNGSIVMDPRFIAAVESSIKDACKFWYIIIDDQGGAVGCASACAVTVDLADYADPGLVRIIRYIPWLSTRIGRLKVLICGLPIGTGNHTLGLAQRSTSPRVLPFLDQVIHRLAIEFKADAVVYKEFGKSDLGWTSPLQALGYHPVATPPSHSFTVRFADFAQYSAALRPAYRWKIRRSRRKLSDAGFEIVVLSDPHEIVRAYTPEVHALYDQTRARAVMRGELIPIELFHELTLRLNGLVELVAIRKDGRILAFNWCLHAQSSYYMMYAGLDYELNRQVDLYFNLMYAVLERGLQKRVSTIVFGLSGDAFKARIGCSSEPLYVFVKGCGAVISFILRLLRSQLVKPVATSSFDIFKKEVT